MLTSRPFAHSFRTSSRLLLGGAVLALSLAVTPAAHAQFGGRASFGEAFQPDILQRDLTLMISTLHLEDWQRPILETLVEDYMTAFNTGVEGVKERMKAAADRAREGGGASNAAGRDRILEAVMKEWGAWRTEKRQLFDKFVENLQSQLGPQQRDLWPKFDRALRRERQLPEGELSGESVDLWTVSAQLQLTPNEAEAIRPAMDVYEAALDEALVNRMLRSEELESEMKQAMSEMNYDKGADIQDRIVALRVLVRNTNDEGIEKVAIALGERGPEFRTAALKAGYRDSFRPHPVMVVIDQALQFENLTEQQRQQITELRAELEGVSNEANQRYYEMIRVEEPKVPRRKVQMQIDRQRNGGRTVQPTPQGMNMSDPIVKMRVEREQLGEPFRQRLMAILNPDQQSELPLDKLAPPQSRAKDPHSNAVQGISSTEAPPVAEGNSRSARTPNRRDPRNTDIVGRSGGKEGAGKDGAGKDGGAQKSTPPADLPASGK
jgi:hypothetical protein